MKTEAEILEEGRRARFYSNCPYEAGTWQWIVWHRGRTESVLKKGEPR